MEVVEVDPAGEMGAVVGLNRGTVVVTNPPEF
jgi:hypothetical protein